MARPSKPTSWRILLTAALAAWVALATARGLSNRTVWKGILVGLVVAAFLEWLWRELLVWRGARPPSRRAGPPQPPQPPQPPESPPRPPRLPLPPELADLGIFPPRTPRTGLLAPFSPLPPPRSLMPDVTSHIDLPGSGPAPFGRLVPFGDGREVIVRRGAAMGHHYGMEHFRRLVRIGGHEFLVVTSMELISPPVLRPGDGPMSPEAAASYTPTYDVLYLPDAEVLLQRSPGGFTDAEVERILAAITLSPLAPPQAPPTAPPAATDTAELLTTEQAMERLRARTATPYQLKAAISVLGGAGPSGAAALLRGYLRDTDLTVIEAACNALARLGAREATADLLDLLRPAAEKERHIDCGGDPFGWYEAPPRASALSALTALRVAEAEAGARALLGDPDAEVQRLARQYLTAMGLRLDPGG